MSDDLVERLSTEAKIWPRSDISGLLRESVTEIERLRAEVSDLRRINQVDGTELRALCAARDEARRERDALRARIEEATVGRVGIQGWMHVKRQELHGKRVALVVVE